jgi:hypothetical protein
MVTAESRTSIILVRRTAVKKYILSTIIAIIVSVSAYGQSVVNPPGPQGTYDPGSVSNSTCTGVTTSASTRYYRMGNVVHVFGGLSIDSPSGGCVFNLSLPVTPTFSEGSPFPELGGTAFWTNITNWMACRIYADTTYQAAQFDCVVTADIGSSPVAFAFDYEVN